MDTNVALAVVVVFMACAVNKRRVNPRCTAYATLASTRSRRVPEAPRINPSVDLPHLHFCNKARPKRRHPLRARPASDSLWPRNLRFSSFWIRKVSYAEIARRFGCGTTAIGTIKKERSTRVDA